MEFRKTIVYKELDFLSLVIDGTVLQLVYKERNLDSNKQLVCEEPHIEKLDLKQLMKEPREQIGYVLEKLYDQDDRSVPLTENSAVAIIQALASALMASQLANNLEEPEDREIYHDTEPF
ncbi:MAG: hypothetical protein KAS32_29480 [Candidatus Peribacteraceae bacterium]|nr:hypothetical protein [Candidatus Peribacteraceae bacterium]